jgi:hypothetical protein
MFAGKAGAYQIGAPLGSWPHPLTFWKGLPRINTLAYYENLKITAVKSFIVQWPIL